jgi:hypothetical protein
MLGNDLPDVPVVDLDFHQPTRTLIAATYGRSMYSFNVDQLLSANENSIKIDSIDLFPNPVLSTMNLMTDFVQNTDYLILDLSGRTIFGGIIPGGGSHYQIDVSSIISGNYILRITESDKVFTKKFIKK